MGFLPNQEAIIQASRGTVSLMRGNRYSIQRLGPNVSGSLLTSPPVFTGFLAVLQRAKREDVEADTLELMNFTAKANTIPLQFGDVLTGVDPSDLATYVFSQSRPLKPSIFTRCEETAIVYRPRTSPAESGPVSTTPGQPYIAPSFESSDVASRTVMTLVNGVYSFAPPTATPASIPLGIQTTARAGGPRPFAIDTSTTSARFVGYLPPLGVRINQNDVIYVDEDHEYIVNSAFEAEVGFYGTVMVLELMGG